MICFTIKTLFILLSSAFSHQYEVGQTYSYSYESEVLLNEKAIHPNDVGVFYEMGIDISPVWQDPTSPTDQLFELKVGIRIYVYLL